MRGIEVKALIKLPPAKQIAALAARGLKLRAGFSYQDIWGAAHADSFTVAKMMESDLLADTARSLIEAKQQGLSFDSWAKTIESELRKRGWWGRQEMIDPADGVVKTVQLGSPRRLEIIFNTNMRTARAAQDWAAGERLRAVKPFRRYASALLETTRESHSALHGTILPSDHEWWDNHMPPLDYNCLCTTMLLSASEIAARGMTISEAPPEPPPGVPAETTHVNERTGQTTIVPWGVHPAFAGGAVKAAGEHLARLTVERAAAAPPFLAAALAGGIDLQIQRQADAAFARWADGVLAAKQDRGESRIAGILSAEVIRALEVAGHPPETAAILLTDQQLMHMARDSKAKRGAAINDDQLRALPQALRNPDRVLLDREDLAVLYVVNTPDGAAKFVTRVNYRARIDGAKITTNQVRTAGIVHPGNLDGPRYETVNRGRGGTPPSP